MSFSPGKTFDAFTGPRVWSNNRQRIGEMGSPQLRDVKTQPVYTDGSRKEQRIVVVPL